MESSTIQEARRLIELHGNVVNFGTFENAVNEEWIVKGEQALGLTFTSSYKWFLRNYVGGEIGGEEIYSIYGMDFQTVNGGDIVFQHLANQANGLQEPNKLVVSETDFGEVFYFDYAAFDKEECPIHLRLPSGSHVEYAEDFYEFLKRRIEAHVR